MPVRDNVLGILRDHFKDDDSDETLNLIGKISDEFGKAENENTDWKKKYDELDKSWRKKYKDRFFSDSNQNDDDDDDLTIEKGGRDPESNPSFEDIFRIKK